MKNLLKLWGFMFCVLLSISNLSPILAQSKQLKFIQGTIYDTHGETLPGVTILIKGTTVGTISDADGSFQLSIPDDAKTLLFSYVGMETKEMEIDGRTQFNVTLEEAAIALHEVVAVGYGTMRKADLTGSVAIVSEDEIKKNTHANVLQGLQGQIPGVYITADGNPVGNVGINVRGLTSFRAAPPLIVIDDLPTTINLRDINPKDIASIQVLKDASAASIYGSRAAGGVIIIQTKQGKVGENKVSYTGSFGVSSFMNRIDLMNTQQYGQALWQAAINDGRDPNDVTQIYNFDWENRNGKPVLNSLTPVEWLNAEKTQRSADTDWFKEGTQLGIQNDHQLTVSGGSEKSKSMLSLNYHENQGTQIHTMFRRFTLRFNSEYNLINDRLTIGENILLGSNKMNNQNHSHSMLTNPPIIPVYDEEGGWGGSAFGMGMDDYSNPIRMLSMNKDNYDFTDKAIGSIYASFKLLNGLSIKTLYGIDYNLQKYRHISFKWKEAGGQHKPDNAVNTYRANSLTSSWTNTLNYNLETGEHRFDALAGIESVHYYAENLQGYRRDIELEDYDYAYLNAATGTTDVSGIGDEWMLLSYFSKLNYAYDNKYLLSATLRYDGSSKFGKNNRFGFFPAASAGWRISEEPFFAKNSLIYDLKLRASWGMNGNSNIPTNALLDYFDADYNMTAYPITGNETGNQPSGFRRVHTGNQNLKWEATQQYNFGIDFGLFNGSLTGSFDYFQKHTNDMLFRPPYLAAIGEGGSHWINAADMSNKGFEFIVTYFGKPIGDFSYSITGNISSIKNKIDKLPDDVKYSYGGNGLDDDILGRPLNSFYGFVADGLFKTQEEIDSSPEQQGKGLGRIRYKDLNGDGRITWEHDRTWIGKSDPDMMYGMDFNAKYKNIDFNMFWQGIAGLQVRNDWKSYSDFWAVWTQHGFNHATRILDAWTPDNPNSTIPALSLQNSNDERRLSTYFMESGAYLKLRHISLGYTLPSSFISKFRIQECRINLSAQNILSIHKSWGDDAYTSVDPENSVKSGEYSNPYIRPQIFMVGIDLSF